MRATVLFGAILAVTATAELVQLNSTNFDALVAEKPFLVEIMAPWCGHCRRLEPTMKRLGQEMAGEVSVGVIDLTKARGLAHRFPLSGIPALFVVRDGAVYTFDGARTFDAIKQFATTSWAEEEPLGWSSPLSAVGVAKGYLLSLGMAGMDTYKALLTQYDVPAPAAVGILLVVAVIVVGATAVIAVIVFDRKEKED